MVKSITSAYLYSLELNQNAEARAREEFSSELQRKELHLTELQKKVEQLQAEKKKMDAESALLTKQEQILTDQLESLRKGAADQEQINQMLKEKLEEAQNQLKENERSKESEEMLKNELLQCKQVLHDTVLALSRYPVMGLVGNRRLLKSDALHIAAQKPHLFPVVLPQHLGCFL